MIKLASGQATPVVIAALGVVVSVVCVPALVAGYLVENDGEARQGYERYRGRRVQWPKWFRVGGVEAEDKKVARVDYSRGLGVDGTVGEEQAVERAG
jgi:hypothetical protein